MSNFVEQAGFVFWWFFSFIGRKGLKQAARVTVAVVVALAAAVVAKRERLTHQT